MARLLAAEADALASHRGGDLAVADAAAQHFDAPRLQRALEPHVRHRRGDDPPLRKKVPCREMGCPDVEQNVAVADAALVIAEDRPVRVAIKGRAEVAAGLPGEGDDPVGAGGSRSPG